MENFKYMESAFRGKLLTQLLCVAILISASFAKATTMIPANLAQLSEAAESAFVIKIESIETTSTSAGEFSDIISGTVVEPVFGDVKTSQALSWRQFRLSRGAAVPSMPSYEVGKEYLIFLTGKGPGTGYQAPVGLGQGAFLITRNPQTGAAMARNSYMNSALLRGLNVDKVAEDIVDQDPKKRAMPAAQKTAEIDKAKAKLRGRGPQALESLKETARFFHTQRKAGRSPSLDYRTTAPAQLVR